MENKKIEGNHKSPFSLSASPVVACWLIRAFSRIPTSLLRASDYAYPCLQAWQASPRRVKGRHHASLDSNIFGKDECDSFKRLAVPYEALAKYGAGRRN
jgi:hypothetical protein